METNERRIHVIRLVCAPARNGRLGVHHPERIPVSEQFKIEWLDSGREYVVVFTRTEGVGVRYRLAERKLG
jgi:hypothetical protein